jgi:hypothetical protein
MTAFLRTIGRSFPYAIVNGNIGTVSAFLDRGVDIHKPLALEEKWLDTYIPIRISSTNEYGRTRKIQNPNYPNNANNTTKYRKRNRNGNSNNDENIVKQSIFSDNIQISAFTLALKYKQDSIIQLFINRGLITSYNIPTILKAIEYDCIILTRYILDKFDEDNIELDRLHHYKLKNQHEFECTVLGLICMCASDSLEWCEIIRDLIRRGISINMVGIRANDWEGGMTESYPIFLSLIHSKYRICTYLINSGANINIRNTTNLNIFQYILRNIFRNGFNISTLPQYLDIISAIIRHGQNPNTIIQSGYSAFYILFYSLDRIYRDSQDNIARRRIITFATEIIQLLLKYGAEIPYTTIHNLQLYNIPEIFTILTNDPSNVQGKWLGYSQGEMDRYAGVFDTTTIDPVHPLESTSIPDNRRRTPQHKISNCPICNTYTYHDRFCNHMQHNCVIIGNKFNQVLYDKYNVAGNIHWCTVCGRICNINGNHYEVVSFDTAISPEYRPSLRRPDGEYDYRLAPLPVLQPMLNDFGQVIPPEDQLITSFVYTWDCRYSRPHSGGGIPEKILRLHIFRVSIKRIQDEDLLGRISIQDAWNRITRDIWNAVADPSLELNAAVARELVAGRFELPSTDFRDIPNVVGLMTQIIKKDITSYVYPTVPWPDADNPECTPIVHQIGNTANVSDAYSLDGVPNMVQFQHRQPDNTIHIHDPQQQCLSIKTIFLGSEDGKNYTDTDPRGRYCLDTRNKYWLDTDQNIHNFGTCIICMNEPTVWTTCACKSKLYPQELQVALTNCIGLSPEDLERYQSILNIYTIIFNKVFASEEEKRIGLSLEKTVYLKNLRNCRYKVRDRVRFLATGEVVMILNTTTCDGIEKDTNEYRIQLSNGTIRDNIRQNQLSPYNAPQPQGNAAGVPQGGAAAGMIGGRRYMKKGGGMFINATPFTTTLCTENTCTGNACSVSARKSRRTHRTRRARRARRIQRKRTRKQY